jgi:hypothetical protein
MLPQADTAVAERCILVTNSAVARNGISAAPGGRGEADRQRKGKAVHNSDEFAAMSDPDFLDERKRVREILEVLTERYRLINIEFDRRAGVKWRTSN